MTAIFVGPFISAGDFDPTSLHWCSVRPIGGLFLCLPCSLPREVNRRRADKGRINPHFISVSIQSWAIDCCVTRRQPNADNQTPTRCSVLQEGRSTVHTVQVRIGTGVLDEATTTTTTATSDGQQTKAQCIKVRNLMHVTPLHLDKDHRSPALASVAEPPELQESRFHPGNSCGLRPVIVTLSALLGSASPCLGGPGTCLWAIAVAAAAAAVAVAVTANRGRQLPLPHHPPEPPSLPTLPPPNNLAAACRLSTDPLTAPPPPKKSALTWREQPHPTAILPPPPSASNPNPSRPH